MDYKIIDNPRSFRSYPTRKYKKAFKIENSDEILKQGVFNKISPILELHETEKKQFPNCKLLIAVRGKSNLEWKEIQ